MYFSFRECRAVNTNHSQMQQSHSNSYPGWRSPLFNYKWSMPFSSITVTENRENVALVNSKSSCKQEAWSGHPVLIMLWLSACTRVFIQACPLFCQNDHLLPSLPPGRDGDLRCTCGHEDLVMRHRDTVLLWLAACYIFCTIVPYYFPNICLTGLYFKKEHLHDMRKKTEPWRMQDLGTHVKKILLNQQHLQPHANKV